MRQVIAARRRPDRSRIAECRSRSLRARRCASVLALSCLLVGLSGSVAYAVPVDVNPNTSDNTNPNASTGGRANHMATSPGNNDIFYLAGEYGGIFKTTDAGVNWTRLNGHLPVMAWDVEVKPTDANLVIGTSWYDGRVVPASGIQRSTDAGATWAHPATSWPNPALEGTANDNTPAGWSCNATARVEPSAFGISIQGNTVAVGTNCGLALSTDSGATFTFIDPTPANAASNMWDVLVQPGIIDVCGNDGHRRSTDGGATWTGGGGGLPTGRCSLAVSPDESDVLFVYGSDNNVYESDNAGGAWTNLGNPQPQGRIPFVVTNQRADTAGPTNKFDLWAGDVQLFSADCTTPADVTNTTTRRCPTSGSWVNRQNGAHWDGGDLLFDSEDADGVDACPVLYSSDGGVHRNTIAASPGCQNPTWTRSNVGYHGLWLWTMDGANRAGAANEDILFGTQDNGTFTTTTAGNNPPTWSNPECCDTFDVLSTPTLSLGSVCCFGAGRFNRLNRAGAAYAGPTEINYPGGGVINGFTWGHRLAGYGTQDNNVALLMSDGLYITDDIQATPIVWTELPDVPGIANACSVETSMEGTTPVFFVQIGQCTGRGDDQLWRYEDIVTTNSWDRIDDNGTLSSGIGIFAVDPNNDDRLYVSDTAGASIRMMRSTDGGTTWTQDAELDTLMTGNGVFKYENTLGPSTNKGGAGAAFQGYPQPVLLSYSQVNGNTIVAGGVDSGVFVSTDGGTNWGLVSDGPNVVGTGRLPRPRYAYFDDEPGGATTTVYVGTQGRGVWRITLAAPTAEANGPYNTVEGTDVTLSAAGSTGTGLTYAWDFDGDGDFDDATGISPSFTLVGQDGVFPVCVKVTNSDGAFATDCSTVTVTNVAPTVNAIASNEPQNEGSTVTVSGTITDPGWLDPLTATINWGDGSGTVALTGVVENVRPNASLTYTNVGHEYGTDGVYEVKICAADDDTTNNCTTRNVTVLNVRPTVGPITTNSPKPENTAITISGVITDPGWLDPLTATVNWGEPGGVAVPLAGVLENVKPDATFTYTNVNHTYGDDGVFTITICAADDDTTGNCNSTNVTITNVNPTATIDETGTTNVNGTPVFFAHIGQPVAFKGRSTDPGSDDLTLRWNWDDGGAPIDASTFYPNNPGIVPDPDPSPTINPRDVTDNKSHAFGLACAYDVEFSALDDDGGSALDTVKVIITGNPANHDKSAGFWAHEYQSASGDEINPITLACYLEITGFLSRVFNEIRNASTFAAARSVLNDGPNSARDRFDRVLLTNWLNFANGAFEYTQLMDTNFNGTPDTQFGVAMGNAETVRLNPASTTAQIDAQRKILQSFDS